MGSLLSLDQILNIDNIHYLGENNTVKINDVIYPFIKGYITSTSKDFQNTNYSSSVKQSAAYFIQDWSSGKIYIGSSGDAHERILAHRSAIKVRKHYNLNFNNLLKTAKLNEFEVTVIFCENREVAYDLEQLLLDKYKNNPNLLNTSPNSRYARLGAVNSEEHKKAVSDFRKSNAAAIEHFTSILDAKRRRVMVNGKEYESLTQAGNLSGIPESTLRRKLRNNNDSEIRWLSDNSSPLTGRNISLDKKKRLSEIRKSNPSSYSSFKTHNEKIKRAIILNGITYPSVRDAVNITKIPECSIHRELKKLGKPETGPYILNYQRVGIKKVSVLGKLYDSTAIAAKELGLKVDTLKSRIVKRSPGYFYVSQVNGFC